jgi:hypothetical protein
VTLLGSARHRHGNYGSLSATELAKITSVDVLNDIRDT